MDINTYKLSVTFTTSILGTQPQKDVATEYITSKVADANGDLPADELQTLPEELQKGTTAFHKLDGKPILYDYMIKGFIKEAGLTFNGLRGVKNLRSKIDNFVFILPRQIALRVPEGKCLDYLERPLRAMTAQGPRTSLARSEQLPEGTGFECFVQVFEASPITEDILRDLFGYGAHKGMGQWRNGSHGQFSFKLAKV